MNTAHDDYMLALRVDTTIGNEKNMGPFLRFESLMNIDTAERRTGSYKGSWHSLAMFWFNMGMEDLGRDWHALPKKDKLRYDRLEWETDMRHAECLRARALIKKKQEELRKK